MDIIDMTTSGEENDGFRYALVAIDNFMKFAWAILMKSKQSPDLVKATESFSKKQEHQNKFTVTKKAV